MAGKPAKSLVQRTQRIGEGHAVDVTIVSNEKGGASGYSVDSHNLPVPDRRLTCDAVGVVRDEFMMKLLFAQKQPIGEGYMSLLTVQISFDSIHNFLKSIVLLDEGVAELEKGSFPKGKVSTIDQKAEQAAAVSASMILVGYSGIDGCMDFYYASPFSIQSVSLINKLQVEPVVRVNLPAPLLIALSRHLKELAPSLPSLTGEVKS